MVKFDQMWFIFQYSLPCGPHTSSIGVAALGFLWHRSSHPDPSTADMTSSLARFCFPAKCCFFFHVGGKKTVRWCQIRRIWRVINQFKVTVTHSSHCNHILVCRSIVLLKQDSLRQFSRLFWNVSIQYYVLLLKLLIHCGFVWKETMQLVSEKVESNACQVVLLWHTFLIVSLWTFQPNLVSCLSLPS